MIAGLMKHYLVLLQPVKSRNKYGAETTEYVETATVHAQRVKISGKRTNEVGEHFADYSAQFNIRDAHKIAEGWQVQQVGEHRYIVTNIISNLDKGFLTLICERLNE